MARALLSPSQGQTPGQTHRGVPMGVLGCVKYLMLVFNALVFVSPAAPGRVGARGPVPRGG